MNTTTEEEEIESKDSQGGGRYHRHLIRTAENICLGITANSDFERKTLLDATRERCCCDSPTFGTPGSDLRASHGVCVEKRPSGYPERNGDELVRRTRVERQ